MRVMIDAGKCTGNAMCWAVAPEAYGVDADGYGYVLSEQVAPGAEERARAGAGMCPEQAVEVSDD